MSKRVICPECAQEVIESATSITIRFPQFKGPAPVNDDPRTPSVVTRERPGVFSLRVQMVRGLISQGYNLYKKNKGIIYIDLGGNRVGFPGRNLPDMGSIELTLPPGVIIQAQNA